MDVVFLVLAQAEFAEAVMYYNAQRNGLGEAFAEEVQHTIERIREYSEVWSLLSRRTRHIAQAHMGLHLTASRVRCCVAPASGG